MVIYQQQQGRGFLGGNGYHGGNCGRVNVNQIHLSQSKDINTTRRLSKSKTVKGNCGKYKEKF